MKETALRPGSSQINSFHAYPRIFGECFLLAFYFCPTVLSPDLLCLECVWVSVSLSFPEAAI
jgi:hypothetical protein